MTPPNTIPQTPPAGVGTGPGPGPAINVTPPPRNIDKLEK